METLQNSSLQSRLTAYSTLAVAGACAVAATPQATASVVYSGPLNVSVPATSTGNFANLVTFAIGTSYASVNGGDATAPVLNLWGTSASRAWLYPTTSTVDRFVSDASNNPLELGSNVTIGSSSVFGTSTEPTVLTGTGFQWTGGTTGYLGFKFLNGAVTEYGWALVSVPVGNPTTAAPIKLLGLAYENTGAAITTSAVPEPGTLGALAMGALGAGAMAWRRRRAA